MLSICICTYSRYEEIKNYERVSNIKLFSDNFSWDEIGYPTSIGGFKKIERNDPDI